MSDVVVVELAGDSPARPGFDALLDACSASVERGACRSGGALDGAALAVVSWGSVRHDRVDVEVGVRARDGVARRRRSLSFEPRDADVERWRAVGHVVAALANELRTDASDAPPIVVGSAPPREPRTEPSSRDRAAPVAARRSARLLEPRAPPTWRGWIGAGPVAGVEPESALGRFGGGLDARVGWDASPIVLTGSVRYERASRLASETRLAWLSGAFGLSLRTSTASTPWEISGGLAGVGDLVLASATRPSTGRDEGARGVLPGLRTSVGLAWVATPLRVALEGDGTWVGVTHVREAGEEVIATSWLSLHAGLQVQVSIH